MKTWVGVWLQALRLKFYPMSWLAYASGALLAAGTPAFTAAPFWLGLLFLFLLEAATVLANEYVDFATDSVNERAGPFNGGSRVLVDGLLTRSQMLAGIAVALLLAVLAALAVLRTTQGTLASTLLLMTMLSVLALGYTVPPLKLAYRTLGELDVGVTDSIGVLLCGYVFLGGHWQDAAPWWLSLPLGLAFIPSITLCAVPDVEADRRAGKQTIAVRFGLPAALRIAQISAMLAAIFAVLLDYILMPGSYGPLVWLGLVHAAVLGWLLQTRMSDAGGARPIDPLMIASLSFIAWYGVLPLAMLLVSGNTP